MDQNLSGIEFYSFDYSIQNELNFRQKSLQFREIELFKIFQVHSENPSYPKCLPKLIHLDDPKSKIYFDSLEEGYQKVRLPMNLNNEKIESAIIALAKFHAFSLEHLSLTNATLMPFTSVDPLIEQSVKEWLIEDLLHLPSTTDDYFARNERAFRDFCLETKFSYESEEQTQKYPIVLCHGNFSQENILFKQNSNEIGEAKIDVRIANWHLARIGNGLTDLAHLLLSSVNSTDRIDHLDHWLNLYIGTFEEECQKQSSKRKGNKKTKWAKFGPDKPIKQFHSIVPGQLIHVLPKLAREYRKFVELNWPKGENDEKEKFEEERANLYGMMTGGFELIRKEFEH